MANYTLTVNSQFDPFSYQELLQPALMATQAHRELEDQYDTLSTEASIWDNLINKEKDKKAYSLYKSFSDDLEQQVEQLAREGLNTSSRKRLLNMKSRYSKDITPLVEARNALREANALRDKLGPKAIFEVDRYTSLDDFLDGKVANNKYIDANDVIVRVGDRAKSTASALYNSMVSSGVSREEALLRLQRLESPELLNIGTEEWNASSGDNFDGVGQAKLKNAIRTGMSKALDQIISDETLTAAQRDASARGWAALKQKDIERDIDLALMGLKYDKATGTISKITSTPLGTGSNKPSTNRAATIPSPIAFYMKGEDKVKEDILSTEAAQMKGGTVIEFKDLPSKIQTGIKKRLSEGDDISNYIFTEFEGDWFTPTKYLLTPKDIELVPGTTSGLTGEQLEEIIKRAREDE